MDWADHVRREEERYRDGERRLREVADADARQRQLTRMGNAAGGAALASLMQGDRAAAAEWFARSAARYRESWDDAPPGSWGRPIGALKALVLGEDVEARALADSLRDRDDFPSAVADALATIAAADRAGYLLAVEDVLESFETRDDYLEDVPVADTVLVLQELARPRDVAVELRPSSLLPR